MGKKLFLIIIMAWGFSFSAQSKRLKIDPPQYYLGGIFGIVPGFGFGHVIQQRYSKTGWIFTLGEVGSLLAVSIGGLILGAHSANPFKLFMSVRFPKGVIPLLWTAGLIFVGFKTWELIDLWGFAEPDYGSKANMNAYIKDQKPLEQEINKENGALIFDVINIRF